MSLGLTSRWMARAITLAVPLAAIAGPLAGSATAKPTRTPLPQILQKPANPTNDTTGMFSWTVAANTTYNCGLDRAPRTTCAGTFHAPSALTDGLHTLTIKSQTQGMRASNWSYTWRVDTVAPAAPSVTAPPSPTSATAVSVTFSDSDTSVARFTCAVDGQPAVSCTSPFGQSGFAEGSHTLVVTAYDAAGNAAPASTHWIVDRTAPDVPVVQAPSSPTSSTSASIPFSVNDPSATFTCAVDGAAAATCQSPLSLNGLAEGVHQVTVAAHDTAGNTSSYTVSWTVDTTAPLAPAIVNGPASETDDTAPVVQFTDFDPSGVQFACSVTDTTSSTVVQPVQPCSSPFVVQGATTDLHSYRLQIVPTDGAGNVGPANTSVAWKLNLSVPFSPPAFVTAPFSPSNVTTPSFAFVAPDAGQAGGATGFLCSLDGAAYASCGAADPNAPTTYTVASALADGLHTFSVETTDGSSDSDPDTWAWTIDTTPPAQPQVTAPDPATVNPTITFGGSDPDVTYLCSVDGGAFVACSSPWTPPAGLSSGTHSLVVEASDLAGNVTQSVPVAFTVQQAPVTSPGGDTTAPVVSSVVTPSSLTAPVVATFSETVTGLAVGSARIMVAGTSTVVPTATSCLAGGSAVACSSSFTAVRLAPAAALVAGQHYAVVIDAAAVHDLAGNPSVVAGTTFRALTALEENNAAVRAAWPVTVSRSAYGGSFVSEHLAGATASWTFSGTSVTWWTVTGPAQGKANVLVDGVRKATVDNYASATKFHVGRIVKGLANRRHTLKIVVLGLKGAKAGKGTFIAVDAFTIGRTRTASPALVMTLRALSSSHFLGGHAAVTDTKGETLTLPFRGTSISWYTVKGANQGKAAVYVDGVLKGTFDNYAARTAYRVARTISHLADKVHTVKIVTLGQHHKGGSGNLVTTDRFSVG